MYLGSSATDDDRFLTWKISASSLNLPSIVLRDDVAALHLIY